MLPGIGGLVGRSGGFNYEIESEALFARMTSPPTDSRKLSIDQLIKSLKSGATSSSNIWSKMLVFYGHAAADKQAARLNWKANAYNGGAPGSIAFTTDRGFSSSNTEQIATEYYLPNVTDYQFSAFVLTNIANYTAGGFGLDTTILGAGAGSQNYAYMNSSSRVTVPTGNNPALHTVMQKAGYAYGYRGSVSGPAVVSSNPTTGQGLSLITSGGSNGSGAVVSFTFVSASLTNSELSDVDTALRAYLSSVGVTGV